MDNIRVDNNLVDIKKKFKNMQKGELHVHLNGLVSTEAIQEVVYDEEVQLPDGFDISNDLNQLERCESLEKYLKPWRLLKLLPNSRKNLSFLVADAYSNLVRDNVSFVELRNSILYIANNIHVPATQALAWVIEDIKHMEAITSISSGLILTVTRSEKSKQELMALINAYEELNCPDIVIGIDIAGNEEVEIDKTIGSVLKYAKDKHGLSITIHAGETGRVENIIEAIHVYHADRIGHGTAAGKDAAVMKLLKQRNICVEVCPISNVLTNSVRANERHPIHQFIEYEVPFVICSDNPGIHKKTLTDDYLAAYMETNNLRVLMEMYDLQRKYSFIRHSGKS